MPDLLTIVQHPLVQHKLTLIRDTKTPTSHFRQLVREIAGLLTYEITRDLPLTTIAIRTPLCKTEGPILAGLKPVVATILRAGSGLLEGVLDLMPTAEVAHVGMYRDPQTLKPVQYYFNAPTNLDARFVIVVDPMLGTGNSAVAAVDKLKQAGARRISLMCLLAAPEGVARLAAAHADVAIFTAAVDERLNDNGYLVPGLGDAGDRMFGTPHH
ncbi:MAG: uracil phosphoribosyltransferase [Rhodobacteraceae bacterium]|nr:uracil phosphoribosyltransferase [Paracoccaceae bacterium]